MPTQGTIEFKWSGNSYVPMRMKDSDSKPTPTPIKSARRCEHIHSICTRCYESWEDDWEVFYERTAGGRRLLSMIRKELPYPMVPTVAGFSYGVYMSDELGRDLIIAPFTTAEAARDWAKLRVERPSPLPTLSYKISAIVTPESYNN